MQKLSGLIKKLHGKSRYRWLVLASILALIILTGSLSFYFFEVPPVMAQSSIDTLKDVPAAVQGQKVLVFSPHPDDETIAVGGYIAQSTAQGADVKIVLVTNGNFHHNEQVRYAEFRKATGILGVPESNLVFLGFPDSKLREMNQEVLYQALKQQIDIFHPDIIIYPSPYDFNPDHSTIGKTVEKILKSEPQRPVIYEYLVHYEVLFPRPREYNPDLYILPPKRLLSVDDWQQFSLSPAIEDLKKEAIFTYRSQLANRWLYGILVSSIRRNELLAVPRNLYQQ